MDWVSLSVLYQVYRRAIAFDICYLLEKSIWFQYSLLEVDS